MTKRGGSGGAGRRQGKSRRAARKCGKHRNSARHKNPKNGHSVSRSMRHGPGGFAARVGTYKPKDLVDSILGQAGRSVLGRK